MNKTHLTLTFRESFTIDPVTFAQDESLTVTYLGGGDLLRCQLEDGRVVEIPSRVVRQEITSDAGL